LIPLTSAKVNLAERMGEKKYQGVFSIFSLIGLIVIVVGLILYSILLYLHQYVSGEQIVEKNNLSFFLT